jgi:hypothetical protein
MRVGERIDQLRGDTHPAAAFAHRAFEHIAHPQFAPDLLHIDGLPFVRKTRIAGDDKQPPDARQRGDDLLVAEFEAAYGADPNGGALRTDQGEVGRFRRFTREDIAARGDNLDIAWLRDTSGDPEDALSEPEELISAIQRHLQNAVAEIEGLQDELETTTTPMLDEAAE